jgi:hypothetical protein
MRDIFILKDKELVWSEFFESVEDAHKAAEKEGLSEPYGQWVYKLKNGSNNNA